MKKKTFLALALAAIIAFAFSSCVVAYRPYHPYYHPHHHGYYRY